MINLKKLKTSKKESVKRSNKLLLKIDIEEDGQVGTEVKPSVFHPGLTSVGETQPGDY